MAKPRTLKLRYLDDRLAASDGSDAESFEEYRRGAVRFGTCQQRGSRERPELRWFAPNSEYTSFAEIQTVLEPNAYVLRVGRHDEADYTVFVNGRKIAPSEDASLVDGDVLRIGDRRFGLGSAPRFPRNEVERAFLTSIQERPSDDDARVVYADWLEERGDFAHAEILRIELQIRLRGDAHVHAQKTVVAGDLIWSTDELTRRFHTAALDVASLEWRTLVARPPIERCDVKLELVCPKRWENLLRTEQPDVRRCSACDKDVVLCTDTREARTIARTGGCVAIDLAVLRYPNDLDERGDDMFVGRVVPGDD